MKGPVVFIEDDGKRHSPMSRYQTMLDYADALWKKEREARA